MGNPTLEYIKGLRKSLEMKKAEIVGGSPSSMPGAEHDSKVPASAKQPDPETKDQTMVPNSGLTTAGAGDDNPIAHTNDLLAGEAALTPEKQPEVSDDAEAKTAEALAAEILTEVNAWFAKQAETPEDLTTDKGTEPAQFKDVKEVKKEPEVTNDAMTAEAECCKDGKCGKCAKCKGGTSKSAGILDMELTEGVLKKIAAVILSTEEGVEYTENLLAKTAGAEAAARTIEFLNAQSDLAEKQAEYIRGQQDMLEFLAKQAEDEDAAEEAAFAPEAEAEAPVDAAEVAEVVDDALNEFVAAGKLSDEEANGVALLVADDLSGGAIGGDEAPGEDDAEKEAQEILEDAIADQVAVPPGQFDPDSVPELDLDDITVDDVDGALNELVEEGRLTDEEADGVVAEIVSGIPAAPAEQEEAPVSPEVIAATLQQAVQNGILTPSDVQETLAELDSVPLEDGGNAAPVEEEAPVDEPTSEKAAGPYLLNAINALRQGR